MRIAAVTALTVLSFAACSGCQSLAPLEQRQRMLVSRHASLVDTPYGTGSCWPITETVFMTAWHVVENRKPADVTINGQAAVRIERIGELDAALVYMDGPHGQQPWPFENRAPEPGETVFKSGYGAGEHWWTEGIGTEDPTRVAIDLFHGDSGCPVFDSNGDVIGIIVTVGGYGHEGRILHHCGIVPMSQIVELLPGDLFEPLAPRIEPALPLAPVDEAYERFLREKKRLGL